MSNLVRKNQLQRLAKIAEIIGTRAVTKAMILRKLYDAFNHEFSQSQIEKDIFCLRMDFDAPIVCDRSTKLYYFNENYDFREALLNYFGL